MAKKRDLQEYPRGASKKVRQSRWICRECGNSALFLYRGTAQMENLMAWSGRATGYKPILDRPLIAETVYEERPALCYVCRSDNITYAHMKDGEYDDHVHPAGQSSLGAATLDPAREDATGELPRGRTEGQGDPHD